MQCVRKFCCPRVKWAVLSFLRARQNALPVCLCVYGCIGVHGLLWRGGLCVCDVGRGQPFLSMEAAQQETHGCVKGDPQGMWDFSLPEEMGILAGKPHGAGWKVRGWSEGGGIPSHLSKGNGSSTFACTVFRFQALQAGTVPYSLYSHWPSKS